MLRERAIMLRYMNIVYLVTFKAVHCTHYYEKLV
jgi:hypothetical protein